MSSLPDSSRPSTPKAVTEPTSISEGWAERLLCSGTGDDRRPLPILANAITALTLCPQWSGVLGLDDCAQRIVCRKPPPWINERRAAPFNWTDADDTDTANWLQHNRIFVGRDVARQAVQSVARKFPFNPVRDWLLSLEWGDESRLTTWAWDYLGCEREGDVGEYNSEVAKMWLIGAVARAIDPGCKMDTCLILEGAQGTYKSTALRILGDPWFTDELSNFGSKDAPVQLQGKWIVELGELDKLKTASTETMKTFIVRQFDHYVPKYIGYAVDIPRRCVFAGTVNHPTYFKDESGNRRFWPLKTGKVNLKLLEKNVEQLWAEAVHWYQAKVRWYVERNNPNDARLIDLIEQQQRLRYQHDPWEELMETWLESRHQVTINEVLIGCIGLEKSQCTQVNQNKVVACFQSLGWAKTRPRKADGGRVYLYERAPK